MHNLEKLKPISAVMWIDENTVPSVVTYGKYDKIQPFRGSQRLLETYKKYAVEEYLDKYMPV